MNSIIAPIAPKPDRVWQTMPTPPAWVSMGYEARCFFHPDARQTVISAVEVARDADEFDRGPEYHRSISKRSVVNRPASGGTQRCTSNEAQQVLADFGMDGAEEDNHTPHGLVRNFWRPVAEPLVGLQCACKAAEPTIVEDCGDYVWRAAP